MALEYRKINKRGYQLQYGSIHSCKKCPFVTKSIFFMLNHVKCHKQPKDKFDCKNFPEIFSCKACDFTTNLTTRFNQHFKRIHSGKNQKEIFACKLYKCKNCSFQTNSVLIWLKLHSGGCPKKNRNSPSILEKPFLENQKKNTSENRKNWNPESRLKEDSTTHHSSTFRCLKCSQRPLKSSTQNKLDHHMTDHSKNKNSDIAQKLQVNAPRAAETQKWHKCSQCIFRTMSRQSLINHRKTRHQRHQDNAPTFKCTSCTFVTSNANHLRVHTLKHSSSFDCNKCPDKFSSLNALIRHKIKEHVDNTFKKNKCELCSFETDVNSELVKHRKEAHPESHFACEKCPFMTRDRNQLKKHVICKHANGKAIEWIKCDFCPYQAKTMDTLKHHKKKHHSEEIGEQEELLLLF